MRIGGIAGLVSSARQARAALRSPARLRLEVPGAFGDPLEAAAAERALARVRGVRSASVSARTGRARVVLDPTSPNAGERARAAVACFARGRAPARLVLASAVAPASRALAGWRAAPSRWLARAEGSEGPAAAQPAAPVPWHALAPEEVVRRLASSPHTGLAPDEAERRLRADGPNALAGMPRRTPTQIVAGQLLTIPTALLGSAVGVSLALGDLLEAATIGVVTAANVVVGYVTEARAENFLDAWRELRAESACVLRGGVARRIDAASVVAGDVLLLAPGDAIPADARVLVSRGFSADESTLTGESEPVDKRAAPDPEGAPLADRQSMVHAGTFVASGEARAIVVATGAATAVGALQQALSHAHRRAAPLEQQLDTLGRKLAGMAALSGGAVVGLGLLRRRPLAAVARSAVALAVAAIPEGVPAVGTTALALASGRLRERGLVIRRLAAAETLGAVSVVCADKTGTLTENRMQVACVWDARHGRLDARWTAGERVALVDERGGPIDPDAVEDIVRIAALNADVDLDEHGEVTSGSGTERALVEFAIAAGYPVRERRRDAKRVGERRRSAELPVMVTVHRHPVLGEIALAKGAPEAIATECVDLDARERRELARRNEELASEGLRVLAFAWHRLHDGPMRVAGLVGLRDPLRAGAREAVQTFARAGIETVMLTGDQERTARAIGEQLGITAERIHSRITPEAKLSIVEALQRAGRVVAMTGDGVNDGPALEAADVGVAMGRRGTDVARAVADVVLATDDLPSLAAAVREGRTLYDNVRRAIAYLVATNVSEVAVSLVGALAGASPLGPMHLLWLNLLTDVAPALALAVEPAERDVMARGPRDPRVPLLPRGDTRRLARQSGAMAAASLGAYALGSARGDAARASTMAFATLVVAQVLHTRRCRSRAEQQHAHVDRVVAGSLALQLVALEAPPLRRALGNARLAPGDLLAALALGAAPSALAARADAARARRSLAPDTRAAVAHARRDPSLDQEVRR